MTTKTELENLVASFEKANNRGSTKEANRILPQIVRAIVDFVENPGVPYTDPKTEAEALFSNKTLESQWQATKARLIEGADLRSNDGEPSRTTEVVFSQTRFKPEDTRTEFEKNDAIVKELEAEKAETCEPCTPTEENPNGVAEAPDLTGAAIQPVGGGVTIGEDGVPRNADGVSLELLQDAQAMGVSPEEAAAKIADAKTKAAPKAKAKPKAEGEA